MTCKYRLPVQKIRNRSLIDSLHLVVIRPAGSFTAQRREGVIGRLILGDHGLEERRGQLVRRDENG